MFIGVSVLEVTGALVKVSCGVAKLSFGCEFLLELLGCEGCCSEEKGTVDVRRVVLGWEKWCLFGNNLNLVI